MNTLTVGIHLSVLVDPPNLVVSIMPRGEQGLTRAW